MANQTANDIAELALGRVSDFGGTYPGARGPMYRRIGLRQRQLYSHAAQLNPERYGACFISALSAGLCDFNDVVSPVPTPDLIQRVEISNIGTSSYTSGQLVNIVRPEDQSATFAPRAMIRDGVLIQVGTDLSLVTSIKAYYAKLPEVIAGTAAGAATVLDLPQPWDGLLEIDLCLWLLMKATKLDQTVRAGAVASFTAEQDQLLGDWDKHIVSYTPIVSSFLPPRVNARAVG